MSDESQKDPDVLFRRGARYLEFGELTAARDTFLDVVRLNSSHSKAWNSLGLVYKSLKEIDSARDSYKKAISSDPAWTEPLVNLGFLEFSLKSYKETKDVLYKYLELGGDDVDALIILARSAFELDDCKTVQKVTSHICELDKEVYEAWEMRGLCYAKNSKFSAALVALNMALELDPRSLVALNAVGDLCYESTNYEGAVSFYEPSLSKRKNQPKVLLRHGTSLWFLDRWNEAIPFLEQYTKGVPDDPIGWNNLGVALREKGEVTRSIECYKRALDLDPNLEIAQKNLETAMNKQMIV